MAATLLAVMLLPVAAVPAAAPAATPPTPAQPRLLVLDFTAGLGMSPDLAKLLANMAVTRMKEIGQHEVVAMADVQAVLQVEQNRQLLGCGEEQCFAKLGDALGAQVLLVGNVTRLGGRAVLTLKLIESEQARLRNQLTEELPNDESELGEAMRVMSYKLLSLPVPELEKPWYKKPWVWGIVGGVVVAGAVTGYLVSRPPEAPDAALGTVVLDD
ncbi:MAG: hypothetical protein HYZ27_07680 [Deltaproteobacteria bacterium]|nr:hypothetical protein [Deltaproteobacteria bacterium]